MFGFSQSSNFEWRLHRLLCVGTKPLTNGRMQITRSILYEASFVAIPSLSGALATSRAFRLVGDKRTVAGRRSLAAQWRLYYGDMLAEERRERAWRLEARLR